MRIAIDIDSTLHHYWDQLSDAAKRRFGDRAALRAAARLGDQPPARRAAAGRDRGHALRRGHPRAASPTRTPSRPSTPGTRQGHFIHITSHRAEPATPRRSAGWSTSACATTTCTAPTTRSRAASELGDRRPHRRQPGQPARRARARHRRRDARASVEPGPVRGGGRHQRRRLARPEPRSSRSCAPRGVGAARLGPAAHSADRRACQLLRCQSPSARPSPAAAPSR